MLEFPRIVPFCAMFGLSLALAACAAPAGEVAAAGGPAADRAADSATAGAAAQLPVIDIPYQRFTLSNGLTVIVHEDHKAPVVAVNVWYHVGSKDEPSGRHGFAHLFEHLMFNGSQHYDDEYFRALEPAGATGINGTTNTDRTNYFETVPVSALDRALWLESDRMGYLTGALTQAKLDEQRGVVLNEKRQDENQPYGQVDETLARETYPAGHPYSWTTIGSEADLNAAKLDDVRDWFHRYYGPNNAVLVLAGDVDLATAKQKVEHYFGALPPGPAVPARVKAWTAPLTTRKHLEIRDRVPLPRVYMVWNVPGDGDHDTVLLDLAADILGGGRDSRLYQRLVYRDQLASSVGVGVDANEIGGQLQIVATLREGSDAAQVERIIDEELQRFISEGPTQAELDATRLSLYSGFVGGLDTVAGKAGLLVANQVFHDDPGEYQQELRWQNAAQRDDVRTAALRWLSTGRLTLDVLPQGTPRADAQALVDRSQLPPLQAAPALQLPAFQHAQLSNGLKLIVAERHSVPKVQMQMVFDAGRATDAGHRSGTAALALNMLDEGAGTLDSPAIARRENALGAQISVATRRDVSVVALSALKPKLAESLDLYATLLTQPNFPEAELQRLKQQVQASITQEKAEPFGLARRVLSRLLFGEGHPYAYAGQGLPDEVAALTRADLVQFQTQWLRPDNATLVVVGDTTLAEIQPMLEARFGHWQAPAAALPAKTAATVALPAAPRLFLLDKPGAEQSLLLAASVAPPMSAPDNTAMQLVDTALGGQFISRLNLNLREDKHWSYGAGSFIAAARGQQIFGAYAPVERAHTLDALREMRRELQDLVAARPLTAAEIDAAKRTQTLALPGEFETSSALAGGIDTLVEFGLPDDYWNTLVPRVTALSAQQIQAAAADLVHPQSLTWIVVGDLAQIEAPLRKAGFAAVTVLDADGKVLR